MSSIILSLIFAQELTTPHSIAGTNGATISLPDCWVETDPEADPEAAKELLRSIGREDLAERYAAISTGFLCQSGQKKPRAVLLAIWNPMGPSYVEPQLPSLQSQQEIASAYGGSLFSPNPAHLNHAFYISLGDIGQGRFKHTYAFFVVVRTGLIGLVFGSDDESIRLEAISAISTLTLPSLLWFEKQDYAFVQPRQQYESEIDLSKWDPRVIERKEREDFERQKGFWKFFFLFTIGGAVLRAVLGWRNTLKESPILSFFSKRTADATPSQQCEQPGLQEFTVQYRNPLGSGSTHSVNVRGKSKEWVRLKIQMKYPDYEIISISEV